MLILLASREMSRSRFGERMPRGGPQTTARLWLSGLGITVAPKMRKVVP